MTHLARTRSILERLWRTVHGGVYHAFKATPSTLEGTDVIGLFRRPYERALGFVESSRPSIVVMAADVPGLAHGSRFTVTTGSLAVVYEVVELKPDPVSGSVLAELQVVE